MSSLLPPNATDAEKALEAATARIGDVPVPLRTLWNPATCPESLLPWLAWSLSIDSWKSYWPIAVKRAVVASAIKIQRHKGTAKSVRDLVASFGGDLALREWWQQTPQGVPHTFDLVLMIGAGGANVSVDDVIAEVSRTKPVRSHFTFTQGFSAVARIGIAAAARVAVYRKLNMQAPA